MNQIRFTAFNEGEQVAQSNWVPESGREDALNALTQFRRAHPNLAYRIERTGDSKEPNPIKAVRFKISLPDEVRYSRSVQEHEKAEVLAGIREMFPEATITEEKV